MDFFEFVIALVALGGTFVTIWVVMIGQRKEKKVPARDAGADCSLQELCDKAHSMNERLETLESILDAEVPGWRERHDRQI